MTLIEALAGVDGVASIEARQGRRAYDVAVVVAMTRQPSALDVERIEGAIADVVPWVCRVACLVTSPAGHSPLALEDRRG